MKNNDLKDLILRSIEEDIGDGDHSSLACISANVEGNAELRIKQEGIIAGLRVASIVLETIDPGMGIKFFMLDGKRVKPGDIALRLSGNQRSILKSERLVLNIMQRMSGIATSTAEYVAKLNGLKTRILDTRKTTPGFRALEKEAVALGGGMNHRSGLYDMIMLKDNHIDFAGGIEKAIERTAGYLKRKGLNLRVEIEARNLDDVKRILAIGKVDRIMLDNFNLSDTRQAVEMIAGRFETESSGGITLGTIRSYAECGVDFISVGALTHHIKSLDMSLKTVK